MAVITCPITRRKHMIRSMLNRQPMSEPIAFKMEKLFGLSAEWILFEKGPRRFEFKCGLETEVQM